LAQKLPGPIGKNPNRQAQPGQGQNNTPGSSSSGSNSQNSGPVARARSGLEGLVSKGSKRANSSLGTPELSGKAVKAIAVAIVPILILFVLGFAGITGAGIAIISSQFSDSNPCGAATVAAPSPASTGNPSAEETANVQTIIGVAKTENLPVNAEVAAVATMLVESSQGLILANQNVPLSEANPNKQGDGADGTSLGLFQQQISTGWSTIAPPAVNNSQAVDQLMNAAYEAEAFFGTPAGASFPPSVTYPGALTKGLQNQPTYAATIASLDPTAIGTLDQKVQGSAYPTRYQAQVNNASALVQANQSAPPVALPVPLTGGSQSGGTQGATLTSAKTTSVLVVGDSITVAGQPALTTALNQAGVHSQFDAEVGKGLSYFMNAADQAHYIPTLVKNTNPGLLVIALGTNDYSDSATYAAQMSAMFAAIPTSQPVLWVLPYYQDIQPGSYQHITTDLGSLDQVIDSQTAAHPNMTTVDMNSVFGTNASYIGGDGLHPTAQGQAVWANAIAQAITTSNSVSAPTACSAQSVSTANASGGYQNPYRSVTNLVDERIDMGVDYAGTGPVYALGAGIVTYAQSTGTGWPGGGYIQYTLTAGPASGQMVYFAECVTPLVTAGQQVTAETVIGTITNCGSGTESGWASATPTITMAAADPTTLACQSPPCGGQWDGTHSTAYGSNFAQLLNLVGQSTVPPALPVNGTLPPTWPLWQTPTSTVSVSSGGTPVK
jgi:lysophospholipase L1-like esterase